MQIVKFEDAALAEVSQILLTTEIFFPMDYRKGAVLFRIYFEKHDFWAFSV